MTQTDRQKDGRICCSKYSCLCYVAAPPETEKFSKLLFNSNQKLKFNVIRRSLVLLAKYFTDTEISHFQSDHGGSEEEVDGKLFLSHFGDGDG